MLRKKGQFWTPSWLAEAMAAWTVADGPPVLFDPAVGPGTFFAAARQVGFTGEFAGYELDDSALSECYRCGLPATELRSVVIGDFIGARIADTYPAIISNPPYIRHHRLSDHRKGELRRLASDSLGFALDGRTGLHAYFLLKCLNQLSPNGRLAFLLPADVCEGVSSGALWRRLAARFRLDAVMTFSEEAAPFPQVDTNAMVVLLSRRLPASDVTWLRVKTRNAGAIRAVLGRPTTRSADVDVHRRDLDELLSTGLSRPPRVSGSDGVPLGCFARVVRGIATGANEFFFLTSRQMHEYELDRRYFVRAIGRTRDCDGDTLADDDLRRLDALGRPTWLLSLKDEPKDSLLPALQAYLARGENMGLPDRALIRTRRPWYRMERRTVPSLLFAYLGRRDCRFILNRTGVVPLTGFLCVYPFEDGREPAERLWRALNHPMTLGNLGLVGKSYGGGAIKVEPRQLDALEIPHCVVEEMGLSTAPSWSQTTLLEGSERYAAHPTETTPSTAARPKRARRAPRCPHRPGSKDGQDQSA